MIQPLLWVGVAILITLIAGCAPYQSRFRVNGNSFNLPKDAQFSWMQVTIPTSNGPISLVISNGLFRMNPAVIDAKTAHDVALIREGAALVGAVAGAVK